MHAAQKGFSLYEMLLTLLLIAVLAGLAVPSFSGIVARTRIHAEINALHHAIHAARKESIMRRRVVTLCPSTDGLQCADSTDWSSGWIMFGNHDADEPPRVDSGEPLLQRHTVEPDTQIRANRRGFTLRATRKRATNGTIVVCDARGRAAARALVISYTGRPRVALHDRSGEAYTCAD